MGKLTDYFEKYLLNSLEKQVQFERLVGEHFMELDFDAGTVRLDSLNVPFQVLGTESDNTLTWLWAWAEEQAEVPGEVLKTALELRAWGEREGLSEFAAPELDLKRADGTMIAVIATAIGRASCYYREHYEGGSLFILLYGIAVDQQPPPGRMELVRLFADMISRYDFNHRNALVSYFRMNDLPFAEENAAVNGELSTGERLVAEFDDRGRILTINGAALD